jgi:hypothetical protein
MLRTFISCQIFALLVLCMSGMAAPAAAACLGILTGEAPQSPPAASRYLRLAEGSSRSCMDGCIAQCRAAQQGCSGGNCRAQFQICARRCVVSCGPR